MQSLRIGLLLGFRQIQRASLWTTSLIVFVMTLTFLNLIAVSGILVGLIVGSEQAVKEKSLGDVVITPLDTEEYILATAAIDRALATYPEVTTYTVRYETGGSIEAGYQERRHLNEPPNQTGTRVIGIDPTVEAATANLPDNVVEGSYFSPTAGAGEVVIGALNLERYTAGFADITGALTDVYPGDKIRLTIGDRTEEFTVRGIVDAKVGDVASAVYMQERAFRRLADRFDRNANTIAIRVHPPNQETAETVAAALRTDFAENAKIRTFSEALPKFITDIKQTFNILGIFIGAIGIIVASITIFIIIFINALSRRKQIGILKGIGIQREAIQVAYILQAIFYALAGGLIGITLTYGVLVDYFAANPIDFPFSDGILVAEPVDTAVRFGVLLAVTIAAGFLPAWIITRQNTLNSILGR